MATTSKDGSFIISGLPLGTYVVAPALRGTTFAPNLKAVRLTTSTISAAQVNFTLQGVD